MGRFPPLGDRPTRVLSQDDRNAPVGDNKINSRLSQAAPAAEGRTTGSHSLPVWIDRGGPASSRFGELAREEVLNNGPSASSMPNITQRSARPESTQPDLTASARDAAATRNEPATPPKALLPFPAADVLSQYASMPRPWQPPLSSRVQRGQGDSGSHKLSSKSGLQPPLPRDYFTNTSMRTYYDELMERCVALTEAAQRAGRVNPRDPTAMAALARSPEWVRLRQSGENAQSIGDAAGFVGEVLQALSDHNYLLALVLQHNQAAKDLLLKGPVGGGPEQAAAADGAGDK